MEKHNPQPQNTAATFVKCLGCSKLVRLPTDPDPNMMARCPRCGDTYQIGLLLDAEIPELELVNNQSMPPTIVTFEKDATEKEVEEVEKDDLNRFIVAPALAKGAKRKSRRSRSRSDSSSSTRSESKRTESEKSSRDKVSVDTGEKSSRSERSSSSSDRSSRRSSSRRSSRSRKPQQQDAGAVEFVKVIMGALMAPPVAQLVIWWGLGLDPLGLGPSVSKFLPPVVPEKFHGKSEETKEEVVESSILNSLKKRDEDGDGSFIQEDLPPAPRDFDSRGFN